MEEQYSKVVKTFEQELGDRIFFLLLLIFTVSLSQPFIPFSFPFASRTLDTFYTLSIPCRQRQVSSNIPDCSKSNIKRQFLKVFLSKVNSYLAHWVLETQTL